MLHPSSGSSATSFHQILKFGSKVSKSPRGRQRVQRACLTAVGSDLGLKRLAETRVKRSRRGDGRSRSDQFDLASCRACQTRLSKPQGRIVQLSKRKSCSTALRSIVSTDLYNNTRHCQPNHSRSKQATPSGGHSSSKSPWSISLGSFGSCGIDISLRHWAFIRIASPLPRHTVLRCQYDSVSTPYCLRP